MSTSGSINFSVSRDDTIEEALMILQVLPEGGAPTSDQLTDHSRSLNLMVKGWQARPGFKMFLLDRITMFLEQDKQTYVMGTDHITLSSDVVKTALASAAASGASTISVDSITDLSASDRIGVELSDGTMHWTTINGAPSGTTVTLTATLTGAASVDATVFSYTTKYARGLLQVVRDSIYRRTEGEDDSPINLISRDEYRLFSSKDAEGTVSSIYYDPQLATDTLFVYPLSSSETDRIEFVGMRTLEDFDAAGDTPDFPQEFFEALSYGLAARLANHYGKALGERKYLMEQAEFFLRTAEDLAAEQEVSVYIQPMDMRS